MLLTSERAQGAMRVLTWFSGKNLSMSGPTRHDTTRPHDALDELISLQPRVRWTNGLL